MDPQLRRASTSSFRERRFLNPIDRLHRQARQSILFEERKSPVFRDDLFSSLPLFRTQGLGRTPTAETMFLPPGPTQADDCQSLLVDGTPEPQGMIMSSQKSFPYPSQRSPTFPRHSSLARDVKLPQMLIPWKHSRADMQIRRSATLRGLP